jgi:hypothetical protein
VVLLKPGTCSTVRSREKKYLKNIKKSIKRLTIAVCVWGICSMRENTHSPPIQRLHSHCHSSVEEYPEGENQRQ